LIGLRHKGFPDPKTTYSDDAKLYC